MEFRSLTSSEIECRVATVTEKGLSLLLYKDARCDMAILDETVGALDWKREHSRDNANCTVYIWDDTKKQWVGKEDTGTESNTEKAKGLASDSFKRACFNWGIGRELYTAPFIWITDANHDYIFNTGKQNNYGKQIWRAKSRAKFHVEKVVVEDGKITAIAIKDQSNKRVFMWQNKKEQ